MKSQGRPVSAYEKYLSVPSLFKGNERTVHRGNSNSGLTHDVIHMKKHVPTTHQQLANQKAKAKEKDERWVFSLII